MHNFARNAGRFSPERVLTLWTWPGISGHVMIVSSFPLISLISFHFYLAGNPCRCDSAGSVVGQILLDAMAKNAMMGPYSTWYTLAHRIADTIYLSIYLSIYIYISIHNSQPLQVRCLSTHFSPPSFGKHRWPLRWLKCVTQPPRMPERPESSCGRNHQLIAGLSHD